MNRKRLGYTLNTNVFNKRGDPWMTEKEGRKEFNRDHEVFENPDLDRYTKAKKAKPKKEPKTQAPKKVSETEAKQLARRRANIAIKLGANLRKKGK